MTERERAKCSSAAWADHERKKRGCREFSSVRLADMLAELIKNHLMIVEIVTALGFFGEQNRLICGQSLIMRTREPFMHDNVQFVILLP